MIIKPILSIGAAILLSSWVLPSRHPVDHPNQRHPVNRIGQVNPFIGTGFHGHTYPGATAPFGGVQLSPDTRRGNWDACAGSHYSDSTPMGFSHTHLSGTGCIDLGDILFRPFPTETARFSHADEKASPGYYAVDLPEAGVYTFFTRSDDGSVLCIAGEEVVNNDGSHAAISATGRIPQQKGLHPFTLKYFEDYEGEHFSWGWKKPGDVQFSPLPAPSLVAPDRETP